jgi:ribosomal protein S18 acetylase RimI-like enzyme
MARREPVIRRAAHADADGIARVHVQAWRETYAGLLPQELLDALSVEDRAALWRSLLEPGGPTVLVAESEGEIVGFGSAGAAREPALATSGEVTAIYLLDRAKRMGAGRILMRRLLDALAADGHDAAGLWVLASNRPAIAFYEAMGGTRGEAVKDAATPALLHVSYRFDLRRAD